MSLEKLTGENVIANDGSFAGGLNTTGGPMSLDNSESSDLKNIDFDKFGSILQRNGSTQLNSSAITNDPNIDGLHWFEYVSSGSNFQKLISVADGKLWKMDDLDGTWDDITGGLTITADNHCDFTNFLNTVCITNGEDPPFSWNGTTAATLGVPTDLTDAKYNEQYNNYLFYANVVVAGTAYKSRIYWLDLQSLSTGSATSFIDVAKDDGEEITRIKVLADRLVIYKTRSIYNLFYTGDSDVPFILQGGGKSNSSVGCVAPFSVQEVNNGHVFMSYDGFYYYDGNNSYKLSDKISRTINGYNSNQFPNAVSLVQKDKNRYWCALASGGSSTNDVILVWDYFNNAWSIYDGMACSSMATVYVNGIEERPYFGDYAGFVYRADDASTVNDIPLGVSTAIDAYYYTNWRPLSDLINQKSIPEVVVYFQHTNSVLTFGYSFDFEGKTLDDTNLSDQYTLSIDLSTSAAAYGSAVYDTDVYAASSGGFKRLDLTSRGRIVRFRFSNNTIDETFRIDGLGAMANLETNV